LPAWVQHCEQPGRREPNPALSAKADAEKIMIKMSSLLGFDPVSRRRNPVKRKRKTSLTVWNDYANAIKTGEIPACKRVKQAVERYFSDLNDPVMSSIRRP
jgi:hypothetical protein